MPDEQGSLTPVRLLIAESSERSAQRFDSILRDAGIATRVQLVDLPMAGDALSAADVMLCNAELPQLERLLPQLHVGAPHVPIILVDHRQSGMKAAQGLRLGAADVVSGADDEALLLVFKREFEHVTRTRRLGELHHALQEAQQRCELLLQSSEAAIAYVHEGMHIHANGAYLNLFGFADVDDVLGLPLMDLLSDATAEALKVELKRFRQQDGERHLPLAAHARDGRLIEGRMILAAAHYEGEACVQVTVRTVAEAADAGGSLQADGPPEAPCQREATACPAAPNPPEAHDDPSVAAAPAHGASESTVAQFVAGATRLLANPAPCMAVLVVQVDQFARLQVEHGVRNGELISARVLDALRAQLTGYPVIPLAAHQFAIAMRQRDRGHLRRLCEGLLTQLAGVSIPLSHGRVAVQASIGAGLLETEGVAPPPERIEGALDLALGTAVRLSEAGGNRFEMAGGNLDAEIPDTESGRMLARINRAIEDNAFRLLFQPIISLRGEACEHYEVHLRMIDTEGAEMRPDAFLDTAIAHGVAGKIDRWVILNAVKALLAHRANGHDTRLTINVTANSIADPEFANWLGVALRAARLPSDAVIFQMAEHDIADSVRQAQAFVQALRALHCQAGLARFGVTGEPFERLKLLPVDYVKLDGRLIDHMTADPAGRQLVTQMLTRLQELGKLSIVPQVETASMLSVLWQSGANFVQGNYLQPPGPEMDFDFNPAD
jgi:multidomain signaling protein FimX